MVGKNSIKIEGYQVKALSNKKIKSGGILAAVRKDTDIELIVTHNNPDKQQLWVQANTKDDKYILGIMYGYPRGIFRVFQVGGHCPPTACPLFL